MTPLVARSVRLTGPQEAVVEQLLAGPRPLRQLHKATVRALELRQVVVLHRGRGRLDEVTVSLRRDVRVAQR